MDIYKKMAQRTFGGDVAPRKRPGSPNGGTEPKKTVVAPNGPSQGQTAVSTAPTGPSRAPATTTAATPAKKLRIPAIFLDDIADWPVHAAKMQEVTGGDFAADCRGRGYRIHTTSVDGFRALQRYLCTQKLPFYTHAFKGGRPVKVVISGLPNVTEAEVIDGLEEQGFGIDSACRLRTSRGLTRSWLVTLIPDAEREVEHTKPASAIYGLSTFLFVRVAVSAYRRPSGPIQCHRCQSFGHGSMHCYRPMKCVRCGGPHRRLHCKKPAEEKGVCVNCKGEHNASYRGCPAFKKARTATKEATARRVEATKAPKRQPAPPPMEREEAEEEEPASDTEDGFTTVKRRRRPPRNPANRTKGTRQTVQRPEEEGPAPAPAPRQTMKRKLEWNPRQATAAAPLPTQAIKRPATAVETATCAPEQQPADLPALLTEVLRQLTNLTGLLAEALQHLRCNQA